MNKYAQDVLDMISKKNYWEKSFLQSVEEVFKSISVILEQDFVYQEHRILEQLVEPDRIISFRVPWRDDRGNIQINCGYRVELNNVLGPYKGGLRFHSSVDQSTLKSLAFEQVFKNALTGLLLGGGKGGSDFSPTGKSDNEIMNFCQSFMLELAQYIGPNIDVPAGDIGVGAREIGYMFGFYRRMKKTFEGVLTGKGITWGGSRLRPEATGFGVVYFAEEMLKKKNDSIDGKKVAVSGFGNVAWGVVKKLNELGGKVITLSGPDGFIHDPDGVSGDKLDYMLKMRLNGRDVVADYASKFNTEFYKGEKPWGVDCDIAIPCAIQSEMNETDVDKLVKNGVKCIIEGANLPLTCEAVTMLEATDVLYAPGKASNAGGVACSGFEMAQNSALLSWGNDEVDNKLKNIMKHIHDLCYDTALEYGDKGNYLMGANIAGFKRVADAMIDQGLT